MTDDDNIFANAGISRIREWRKAQEGWLWEHFLVPPGPEMALDGLNAVDRLLVAVEELGAALRDVVQCPVLDEDGKVRDEWRQTLERARHVLERWEL